MLNRLICCDRKVSKCHFRLMITKWYVHLIRFLIRHRCRCIVLLSICTACDGDDDDDSKQATSNTRACCWCFTHTPIAHVFSLSFYVLPNYFLYSICTSPDLLPIFSSLIRCYCSNTYASHVHMFRCALLNARTTHSLVQRMIDTWRE